MSRVTTELSTSDPTARASPISETRFSEIPCVFKRNNVNIAEIGIESDINIDALISFKNISRTIAAIIKACNPLLVTFDMESLTISLLSVMRS